MPNLSVDEQRKLGAALGALLQPLPNDQRLLLLVAALYGEGRSQGLVSGEIVAFCERICAVHEQGVSVQVVRSTACPLCGSARGGVAS